MAYRDLIQNLIDELNKQYSTAKKQLDIGGSVSQSQAVQTAKRAARRAGLKGLLEQMLIEQSKERAVTPYLSQQAQLAEQKRQQQQQLIQKGEELKQTEDQARLATILTMLPGLGGLIGSNLDLIPFPKGKEVKLEELPKVIAGAANTFDLPTYFSSALAGKQEISPNLKNELEGLWNIFSKGGGRDRLVEILKNSGVPDNIINMLLAQFTTYSNAHTNPNFKIISK